MDRSLLELSLIIISNCHNDCPCTITKPVHTVYGPTTTPKGGDEDKTPILDKPTDPPAPATKTVVPEKEYWTTTIVPEYVTYCPYATTFTHGEETYVVTEPKTVTVTSKSSHLLYSHMLITNLISRVWRQRWQWRGMYCQLHRATKGDQAPCHGVHHKDLHHV